MFRPLFLLFPLVAIISCAEPEKPAMEETDNSSPLVPVAANYSFQSFEVIDSAGVAHGWGYDIYSDGKRMIHQLNIPGEAGTDGFVTAAEADKVAALVVSKLQSAEGFPTITHEELVQLGITLKTP